MSRGGIIITGASSGIGEACALRLDRAGFAVFAGVRSERDAEALRSRASAALTPIMLDVADEGQISAAVDQVGRALGSGRLHGLVNNAGTAVAAPIEFLPLPELRRQFEVNFLGQIAVTQAVLPLLRRAHGRVVNIGSIGGRIAAPMLGPYASSKAALESMNDALRRELKPWGIGVSLVMPGSIKTAIWSKGQRDADAMLEQLPQDAHRLYGADFEAARAMAAKAAARAIPADAVARVVEHALTARRPRAKYLVGTDAKIAARLGKIMPVRLLDALVLREAGTGRPR